MVFSSFTTQNWPNASFPAYECQFFPFLAFLPVASTQEYIPNSYDLWSVVFLPYSTVQTFVAMLIVLLNVHSL